MGIYDRDYARPTARRRAPMPPGGGGGVPRLRMLSVNTWLIIVNVAIYIVGAMVPAVGSWMLNVGHFSTAKVFFFVDTVATPAGPVSRTIYGLEVWRAITFQFLHANFTHILFNMIGLFFFGSLVERFLGRKKYLAFYLMCGISGGLMYLLLNLLGQTPLRLPGILVNDPHSPLIGASAGVFGVIMACAYIAPNSIVQLLIPPIPLKMRTFAYGYVALAAIMLLFGTSNAGGEAAHIGGAIAGFFFIRNSHLLRDFFEVFKNSNKKPNPPSRKRQGGPSDAEIDRILAKVGRSGLHSLTERERRILREGSASKRAS